MAAPLVIVLIAAVVALLGAARSLRIVEKYRSRSRTRRSVGHDDSAMSA